MWGRYSDLDRISAFLELVMAEGYLYILASGRDGLLYTGATTDVYMRMVRHRDEGHAGYAGKRGILRLVYVERHDSIEAAIAREKLMKKWKRAWKVALIEKSNPEWAELWVDYRGGDFLQK